MKAIICFAAIIAVAVAYPAQEGAAYTNEAIRQAQTSHLIPQNAQIQKVRSRLCNTNWHFKRNFTQKYEKRKEKKTIKKKQIEKKM